MRTIYKYPLIRCDVQQIEMPDRAIILSAKMQQGSVCLWAEVENTNKVTPRTIEIHGTGNMISMKDNRAFIDTVQDGQFVWHIYERTTNNNSFNI